MLVVKAKISSAILAVILLTWVNVSSARHWQHSSGRALLQQNLPANQDAYEAALNATGTGRQSLTLYGASNATLINLVSYALLAHEAAEEIFATAATGQVSATLGGAAAAGASLLATTAVLGNDSEASREAEVALNAADSYVRAIRDENPLQTGNATFANLILLANLAHDGTLIQYYQNLTAGQPQDNATFADSILSVPDLVDTAQTQLSRGAYPAMALITMEIAVRNILGATYVYNADAAAAYQQGVSEARLVLKAVKSYQTGSSCSTDVNAAVAAVEAAVDAAATAAEEPTLASVQAAAEAANSAVGATSCTDLSPALAPAPSAETTASGGR